MKKIYLVRDLTTGTHNVTEDNLKEISQVKEPSDVPNNGWYKAYVGSISQASNISLPVSSFQFQNEFVVNGNWTEIGTGIYQLLTSIPDTESGKFVIPANSNRQANNLWDGSSIVGQYVIYISSSGGFVSIVVETTNLAGASTSLFDINGSSAIMLPEVRYYFNSTY